MNLFVHSAFIRKVMLMTAMIISQVSLDAISANPDATWSASFRLNMTKAVNQHIFMPDSDYVSLVIDHNLLPVKLVQGPDFIYTATLSMLDSGVTYHYNFSINDSLQETVTRSFTAQPGMVNLSDWWNNQPINITTFIVNMQYALAYGIFDPASDSVFLVGTMNNWKGSPKMQRIGTTLNYSLADTLFEAGSVQQYKYRINQGDTAKYEMELVYKPNRIIRIPDTLLTVTSDFNNWNPAKRLMTFNCDMGYYVKAHHFNVNTDYLDVAGNFNGNGANDVLFDTEGDTIYSLELHMDTAWFHQNPLSFKFRINGDWNTAELTGKPNRTYVFHDTINQNPNIFGCYYNDLNPFIATPPWVYNVAVQGLSVYKKFLSGTYAYENVNGIPEGISTYRWLRSTNAQGLDAIAIDSAIKITYVVDTLDIGRWLVFEVTPISASGDSASGTPVRAMSSQISAWDVGISENSALIARIFPNPASDYFTVEARKEIAQIEVLNYLNQTVMKKEEIGSNAVRLFVGGLPKGFYLVKATTTSGQVGIGRVIKY
ncbi:MAG: T9SS type A sorting domain-containing protein [Bacteroidota bacterium]